MIAVILAVIAVVTNALSTAFVSALPLRLVTKRVVDIELSFSAAFIAEFAATLISSAALLALYLLTSFRDAGSLTELIAAFGVSFVCRSIIYPQFIDDERGRAIHLSDGIMLALAFAGISIVLMAVVVVLFGIIAVAVFHR